ncbi:hypothetical protein CL622_02060 [archaeon]|nr:hypothetical protein [archaeon]|tara:strand:+ start:3132 stop:3338 length:207 start_codon:yes stop_codon:yes gene_type:complete
MEITIELIAKLIEALFITCAVLVGIIAMLLVKIVLTKSNNGDHHRQQHIKTVLDKRKARLNKKRKDIK